MDPEVNSSDPVDATPESSAPGAPLGANETAKSNNQGGNSWTDDFSSSLSGISFRVTGSEGEELNRGDAYGGEERNAEQNNQTAGAKGETRPISNFHLI